MNSGTGTGLPLRERLRAVAERRLDARELGEFLAVPITPQERAEVLSLVEWFRRRYPTPAERLAYIRRAYERWTRSFTSARGGPEAPRSITLRAPDSGRE